ncbi:MAG TPA: type I methionyl aminopeptidase [Thermomicrobiales bacterium]|nr:type I methionyl aminopeptidase [Thermomicrobiales bacterium]
MAMTIKNASEIDKMHAAGRLVGEIHVRLREAIAPGVTTAELDRIAAEILAEHGATSSFLGYHGYPATICASINEEIVHGIPGSRRLRAGDIVSIDVGAILAGYHGDSAWTYPVGEISEDAARLLRDTEASLGLAIEAAKAGNRLGAVGAAVEQFAIPRGYGVIREYGGHGIGRRMHEDPHVPNHGQPDRGPVLRLGLTLAIEPMLTSGGETTRQLDDGWTVVTADGSLAAHFEHTVVIGPEGGVILTERPVRVLH